MHRGGRNRLMTWTGSAIPYKPGKNDLLEATRKVSTIIDAGGVVAIAAEGRIHPRESELLPLSEGAAYFAIRSGIPLVPIAINGTSWLRFGGRVRVRVGEPFETSGRPSRAAIEQLTADGWTALHDLVADVPEQVRARPVRAVAHGAVQRVARGVPRGRPGRPAGRRTRGWPARDGHARLTGSGILRPVVTVQEGPLGATGLSADPKEYRVRLADQEDTQIDAWVSELLRDVVIRRGIVKVVTDFRTATRLDEAGFERVFASGGGAPAVIGHDRSGHLVVPTTTLFALVPGLRSQVPDARDRLIDYLVANFGELVYV